MRGSIADYVSYDSMAGDAMKAVEAGLARRREEKRPKKMPRGDVGLARRGVEQR